MSIRQRNAHFTDWAAVCRALNTATESEARTALESSDNPFYYYVCYIKSTKEIYTHGQFYNGSEREDLLHLIQALTEEVAENEEVTARTLAELSENKASRGEVELLSDAIKASREEVELLSDAITELSSGGIAIVDSVDQLDPNAELGSLASVVEPGSITETLISELPQPDSSIINMDTGFIDATSCPQVSGLSIIVPEGPIPVSMELTESEMLYFCSENVDLGNKTTGIVLGIFPQIVNNEIIALAGMYMNVTTNEQKEWLLFQIQDGVVTADQAAIDECNAYIKDLHYIGAMPYIMEGLSLTTEQLIIYDNVVKVTAGVPSKAHVYLKKDNWEELYAKDFEKLASNIDKVETSVNAKADKMPIESYDS